MNRYLLLILAISLFSCGSDRTPVKEKKESVDTNPLHHYKGPDYESINNCLRTTLSYKMQVEPRDYDSLATYYFHEIRDYTDPDVRSKNNLLKTYKQTLKDSASLLSEKRQKVLEGEIDILQQEINSHLREVIGYVFVHSFIIKEKDTMSAIFVMDQNCGFKEFIKVKVISDPNPEDYVESIRSIEK